ncbi:unknown [Prevotella sp. CAG:891]|nr:unknown [Prevotella sp. CAG:891]
MKLLLAFVCNPFTALFNYILKRTFSECKSFFQIYTIGQFLPIKMKVSHCNT